MTGMRSHLDTAGALRALAVAYAVGGLIGLVADSFLSDTSSSAILAAALLSLAAAAGLLGLSRVRPSEALLAGGIALAAVIVSIAITYTEEMAANSIFYLFPAAFAAYCLPARGLVLVMGVIGVGFGGALYVGGRGLGDLDRWVITVGCLWATGGLLVRLRQRIDALVAQLERASETDALTGVLNRRGFDQRLVQLLAEHARRGAPLGLLVIDVDRFKQTNDRLGHAAGDEALRLVADTLERGARAGDIVTRIGGEEFAMLLPDTDLSAAGACAERLRAAVVEASAGATTVSIGAGISASPTEDGDGLLRRADRAMYLAKVGGRDRVALASEAPQRGTVSRARRPAG